MYPVFPGLARGPKAFRRGSVEFCWRVPASGAGRAWSISLSQNSAPEHLKDAARHSHPFSSQLLVAGASHAPFTRGSEEEKAAHHVHKPQPPPPLFNQTICRGREARPCAGFGSHQAFFHPPNPSKARHRSLPSLIKPLLPGVSAPPRRAALPVRQQTSAPCSPLTLAAAVLEQQ